MAKNVSIKNKHKQYNEFTWFTADQSLMKKATQLAFFKNL